jgi:hypothetical protein
MKNFKYFVVMSFLFLPSLAFAQFGLSGGGIAGTGIQPFSKSTNTYTNNGGGSGNNNRDNESESRPQHHEMTPEEKQAQRD